MPDKKKKPYAAPKTNSTKVSRVVTNTMRKLGGKPPLPSAPVLVAPELTPVDETPTPPARPSLMPPESLNASRMAAILDKTPPADNLKEALTILREARQHLPLGLAQRIDALLKGR